MTMTPFPSFGGVQAFASLMTTPLTVANPSTSRSDLFGVQPYSTETVVYMAHVAEATDRQRKLMGLDAGFKTIAWVISTSTSAITEKSSIVLPDGSHPSILKIEYPRDEHGVHHTKIAFG